MATNRGKSAPERYRIGDLTLDAGLQAVFDEDVELIIVSRGSKGALVTNGDYRIEMAALDVADDPAETRRRLRQQCPLVPGVYGMIDANGELGPLREFDQPPHRDR